MSQDQTTQFNDLTYAIRLWGEPSNPSILMTHGWLDNVASFDAIASILSEHYFLIAVDLPGHGLTDHLPAGVNYHFLEMVMDLAGLCQHLEAELECLPIRRLLGHSMGGSLFTLLASIQPERFDYCMTLESLGPTTLSDDSDVVNTLAKAAEAKYFRESREPVVYPDIAAAVKARRLGGFAMTEAAATRICERNLKPVTGGWVWSTDARLRRPSMIRLTSRQVLAFLKALSCPLLVIETEDGWLKHMTDLPDRLAAVKRLHYHKLPGGHHAHMEAPAALFAEKIQTFLSSD